MQESMTVFLVPKKSRTGLPKYNIWLTVLLCLSMQASLYKVCRAFLIFPTETSCNSSWPISYFKVISLTAAKKSGTYSARRPIVGTHEITQGMSLV